MHLDACSNALGRGKGCRFVKLRSHAVVRHSCGGAQFLGHRWALEMDRVLHFHIFRFMLLPSVACGKQAQEQPLRMTMITRAPAGAFALLRWQPLMTMFHIIAPRSAHSPL